MKKGLFTRITAAFLVLCLSLPHFCTEVQAAGKAAVVSKFSTETQKIVEAHINDFNASNFTSKMNAYGGYEKYLASLGGVFAQYAGDSRTFKVQTAGDLQACAEYVYGLMCIYGFDYNNGTASKYQKWRANDGVTSDAFYPKGTKSGKGLVSPHRIDIVCSGKSSGDLNITTCCDFTVDYLMYKAGLFGGKGQPTSTNNYKSMISKYNAKIISDPKQLQPGDIIECFRKKITNYSNPGSWSSWYHACVVGEVDKAAGTVTLYQGGSAFIKSGNYKQTVKMSSGLPYTGWVGIRFANIDPSTSRSAASLSAGVGTPAPQTTTTTKATTTTTQKTTTTTTEKTTTTTEAATVSTTENPAVMNAQPAPDPQTSAGETKDGGTGNTASSAPAAVSTGRASWIKDEKGWRYQLEDGSCVSDSWYKVKKKWYYFGGDSYMKTGWIQVEGKWYYLHPKNGNMLTGWQKVKNKYYYLKPGNGRMLTGWQKVGKYWYYLDEKSGRMRTGWLDVDGHRYYLKGNGRMVTGTVRISGKTYHFRKSGELKK